VLEDATCVPNVDEANLTQLECAQVSQYNGGAASWEAHDNAANAISDAGLIVTTIFYSNLPIILSVVVAITITLWGVRWIVRKFGK